MKDKIIAEEIQSLEEERPKKEYTHLGGFLDEDEERTDLKNAQEVSQKLMDYRYFDGSAIRKSIKISSRVNQEGERLLKEGKIVLKNIYSGFDGWKSQRKGQLNATGYEGSREFSVWVIFERNKLVEMRCNCKKCAGTYYGMYDISKTDCPYKAGALKLLEDHLKSNDIGDATDFSGHRLLTAFESRRANMVTADAEAKEESLLLVPRLTRKNGKLSLSFKVGEKKLFIIKKLDVFCDNVKKSANDVYGSNTEFNHDVRNFTDEGRRWIRLINKIVREEKEFQQRLYASRYYYGREKESVGGSLELFGWRLDELYDSLGSEVIEFEDKDAFEKKKQVLTCAKQNPKISIQISEDRIPGNSAEFHGILVEGHFPDLYYGTDSAYYISDSHLNKAGADFLEKAQPLANLSTDDYFSFHVGRNRISEFYSRILPELESIAAVTETQPDRFRSYVMPETQFIFYLDTEEDDAVCRTYAVYGGKEYSVLEGARKAKAASLEPFRDHNREEEMIYHVNSWFPIIDWDNDEMRCGKDETLIYRLMKEGTEKLMELGEVRCTKRFLGASKVNKVKVSVGVSLSSGLLDLNFSTEDVAPAELLDILKSYRKKKKYYRLKDGSFVDLDEPSLEMLAELSKAMNLKDKELLKGKMKLPMYRTLYLDKLLEEHEGIYSSRDSHFKKIVKGFKTIKDAEFEKFAPQLKVCLVTGNQEERQKKIEAYKEADVLVTSYDLLKRDIALYEGKEFSYEIIDEAQYIKNHTTAAAKAVKVISSRIRYALTGTPIENRLSELWSIFDYLMPGFLYEYETFKREIETPVVKSNDEKALGRLQKMTGPFILRRLKEDVLKDLPEKLEEFRYVRLGNTQQKLYDGQVVHMKEQIARQNPEDFNKNKLQILAELTRLRQICCDPSLCFENYKGETAKLEACLELIRSAMDGGHRMLVFSQFTSMLEILQTELSNLKIPYFTITGSTSKEKRLELVKKFNEGEVPVFLISLKAGGVGLNLTGADVVIHYDPWWNLAAQNQATDRAHRIGQTKKVTVYKLIAKQTIEEKIQKLQESKKNLADQVINGEGGSLGAMGRDELLELLEV